MSVVNTECAFKESALLLVFHSNGSKTLSETLEGERKEKKLGRQRKVQQLLVSGVVYLWVPGDR